MANPRICWIHSHNATLPPAPANNAASISKRPNRKRELNRCAETSAATGVTERYVAPKDGRCTRRVLYAGFTLGMSSAYQAH